MSVRPYLARFALLGAVLAAPAARAGDLYSYVDSDGVAHFSNAPSDPRFRRIARLKDGGGVYRGGKAQARARPLPRSEAQARYREHIRAAATKYNLPEALLLAVMAVESNFDHRAVSEKGAMGLMQLMPGTARDMYVGDAYEPAENIEGGARYLRILANQYAGDMVKTLAAYNAGPEAVRRAGDGVPNIPETREYVRKVVALYEAYKAGR
ncbi:lytic transglycosylase domain-containing protein [Anaeromyxobacter sp. PSR-1]|uniref:lytic transglycosylase domain-containing protein n=1 Tax=unclassified Anaeromyxobacter TaxID=2620896 RepID=UPI0005DC31C6|nr:lytic transglycosylase domain-containing protein [Anaeromyxobacter sp. PSR-1]GAO01320.1 putative murein lytic transglycosylase YjbJ [Anaeromyxobacter sp. PSR-1]